MSFIFSKTLDPPCYILLLKSALCAVSFYFIWKERTLLIYKAFPSQMEKSISESNVSTRVIRETMLYKDMDKKCSISFFFLFFYHVVLHPLYFIKLYCT